MVAGDEIPEIIIGMEWLKTKRLVVDLAAGILTIKHPGYKPPDSSVQK
ncbi:hypothetical protein QUA56_07420 [Microcoleus sp. N3A4]